MNWFNTILGILLFFILVAINNLPNHIYKMFEEKYKNKNNRQLQIESYFKQLGGKKQEEILSKWTDLLTNMQETLDKYTKKDGQSTKLLMDLMHDTIMYGSDRTIKYVAYFRMQASQDVAKENVRGSNDQQKEYQDQKYVVIMACIVSNLKEDFTGYRSDPLDLLKIIISDYDKYEVIYQRSLEEIKKDLEENNE